MKRWRWLLVASVVVALRSLQAFDQDVYVWQRRYTTDVVAALEALPPSVQGVHVLAAEVAWRRGQIEVVRPGLSYPVLSALKHPVGMVLRIGPFSGSFSTNDEISAKLVEVGRSILSDARSAGVEVAELQIDFDCAESKLAGYELWLRAFRRDLGTTKLTITALPVWMKHPEFASLLKETDGFVLQVHSLEKPTSPDQPFTLCDPQLARAWVSAATKFGVPFRVALPTYGYVIGFAPAGPFLGLSADGNSRDWPAGTRLRTVRSDPAGMSALACELATKTPSMCSGVVWFRLPVAGDRLNWDSVTFAAVIKGETPRTALVARVVWKDAGLAEIVLENQGLTTAPAPSEISVSWRSEGALHVGDGLSGYELETQSGARSFTLVRQDRAALAVLPPGRSRRVAWMRFDHEVPLVTQIVSQSQ